MYILRGKQISRGISIGKLLSYHKQKSNIQKINIENVAFEVQRFQDAQILSVGQLKVLYEQAVQRVGQKEALIFGMHQMLIEDVEFTDAVRYTIEHEKVNAEYAVSVVAQGYERRLEGQERADDMRDIAERLIRNLTGEFEFEIENCDVAEPSILVADALMPSEVLRLKDMGISGVVLKNETQHSHVAILARTLELPMLSYMENEITDISMGQMAVLDATEGCLYLEVSETLLQDMRKKVQHEKEEKIAMEAYGTQKTKMRLCANVADVSDLELVRKHGADGIGLVRSEALWLSKGQLPSEEEQFQVYRHLVENMSGKKVVIRTWDIGGDKLYKGIEQEGRGIQFCLSQTEIFKAQLRAICKASYYGNVEVLFPMVTSLREVVQAKQLLYVVQKQLEKEEIPFDKSMRIGIMLETPEAMEICRTLSKEVDFCSVGTNDLMRNMCDKNPSEQECKSLILSMVEDAVEHVHAVGKTIGICGEMGADETLTHLFVAMGVDELSVAPPMVLNIRKKILECEKGISL